MQRDVGLDAVDQVLAQRRLRSRDRARRDFRHARSASRSADRNAPARDSRRTAPFRPAPRVRRAHDDSTPRPATADACRDPRRKSGTRSPRRRSLICRCLSRSGSPIASADTLLHQVDPGHHLGHAVLDLDPRVHLDEVEIAVGREQELHRADVRIADHLRPRAPPPCPSSRAAARVITGHGASSSTF